MVKTYVTANSDILSVTVNAGSKNLQSVHLDCLNSLAAGYICVWGVCKEMSNVVCL